jgi:hypothetical protein
VLLKGALAIGGGISIAMVIVTIAALINDRQNYICNFGAWLMVKLSHKYTKVSLMSLNYNNCNKLFH